MRAIVHEYMQMAIVRTPKNHPRNGDLSETLQNCTYAHAQESHRTGRVIEYGKHQQARESYKTARLIRIIASDEHKHAQESQTPT